jgi:hypothetical protein
MCKAWCVVQGRIFKKNRNQPSRVNMTPPTFDSPTKVCICSDPQLDFVWKFRREPPKGGKSVKNMNLKYVNICNFGLLNPILGKATWNNVNYFNFTWLYSKQNRLMATAPLTSTQIHCGIQGEHIGRKLAMIVRLSANHRAFSTTKRAQRLSLFQLFSSWLRSTL